MRALITWPSAPSIWCSFHARQSLLPARPPGRLSQQRVQPRPHGVRHRMLALSRLPSYRRRVHQVATNLADAPTNPEKALLERRLRKITAEEMPDVDAKK